MVPVFVCTTLLSLFYPYFGASPPLEYPTLKLCQGTTFATTCNLALLQTSPLEIVNLFVKFDEIGLDVALLEGREYISVCVHTVIGMDYF